MPQAVPKKRPHKKSRLGCDQCRKRRVKCDEKTPRCVNCTKRGDECIFPYWRFQILDAKNENPILEYVHQTSFISPASTDQSGDLSADTGAPTPPIHEPITPTNVALMHYWCTRTCQSFTREGSELFRDHVGQEALQNDYLMEAVLAVTLLHQASAMKDPMTVRPMVDRALQHQSLSVSGLRQNLHDLSSSNCDAAFVCSVLVMVCAIVSPLMYSEDVEQVQAPSETVFQLVKLMNGVSSIVNLARPWIEQGPIHRFFGIVEPRPTYTGSWHPATELRHLVYTDQICDGNKIQTFENAIEGLERVVNRETCAVSWVMSIGEDFIDELREGDPIAMMIFMHWGVLLHITDDMWWKKYSGSKLVQQLSSTLVEYGEEWERMSRWCQQEVGLYE